MPTGSQTGLSRRAVLRGLGGGAMVGLAGCSRSQADPVSPTDIGGGKPGSVFQSLSFDLGDLVIGLPEDHGVSRISLVEPDGTVFTSVSPDFAATTVRMAIADPEVGRTDYTHYKPGVHELVAKVGDETERRSLELSPEVSITNIERYSGGDKPVDAGNITFRLTNRGTAPTWPYQTTFDTPPNWAADNPLSEYIGIQRIETVDGQSVIIPPGEYRTYTATRPPLLYDEGSSVECTEEISEFTLFVGLGDGSVLSRLIRATALGERVHATIHGQYVCSDSAVELIDE
jgi:hypothetical protein